MEKINPEDRLLVLTRAVLDLEEEKKAAVKDYAEQIKDIKDQIKVLCNKDTRQKELV